MGYKKTWIPPQPKVIYRQPKGKEVYPMNLDDLVSKINKLSKVVRALTQLALEIGTLVAVIRFIILWWWLGGGVHLSPLLLKIYHTIGGLVNETVMCFSFGSGFSDSGVAYRGFWSASPAFQNVAGPSGGSASAPASNPPMSGPKSRRRKREGSKGQCHVWVMSDKFAWFLMWKP